ncbi:MAG: hypothetical protein ACI9GW_000599 [Halieaceae bacterium]|jgi:hypothetical protein
MTIFILSFVLMALIIVAMAVGVLFGGQPIKGSCGGMGALGIDTACDICGGDPQRCEDERVDAPEQATTAFYNADKKT